MRREFNYCVLYPAAQRDNLRNPPKTTRECTETLAAQGLKKFAGLITARLE